MSDPNKLDPNVTHVGIVLQKRAEIPPDRLQDKTQRTIGGVCLALAGVGVLVCEHRGYLPHSDKLDWIGLAAVALGFLSASLEIIRYPFEWAIAKAKDIVGIAVSAKGGTP
jgi:hypothetical protein